MEREIHSVRVQKSTRSKQRKEKGVQWKKKARGVVCGGKREARTWMEKKVRRVRKTERREAWTAKFRIKVYGIVKWEVEEEKRRKARYILESDVQSRTMAGALSENAPRPVSVVAVGGATVDNARSNQINRPQVLNVIFRLCTYLTDF